MKRALLHGTAAILLGALTMVAPLVLLKPDYYELLSSPDMKNTPAFLEALDGGERVYDEKMALERALRPSNLSSAGLILVPSLILAIVVSILLKKRMTAAH